MNKNNSKKYGIFLYLIVLISVFAMFIGTAYAYHTKLTKMKDEKNVSIKQLDMLLMFNNGNQINGHNIRPGYEESKEFSIENYSEDTIGKYNITLELLTPFSNMVDENFVYVLEAESDSKDTTNKLINISETPVPAATKNLGTAIITPKNTHKYKLTVRLNSKANKKKYSKENIFALKIKITNEYN